MVKKSKTKTLEAKQKDIKALAAKKAALKKKQPQSVALVLLILQIIGALPQIIEAARKLWEIIKGIKNRELKAQYQKEFRKMVFRREKIRAMTAEQNAELKSEFEELGERVHLALKSQGGKKK